ncbi:MAG: hypothetical protein RBT33_03125 [Candidatus Dojkabacteria bacterium]|jgi:hypothetical protein|nr:hypothetical protein [Candidatus Dojkabacteria bacterium]
MKKIQFKKKYIIIIAIILIVISFITTVFVINIKARELERYTEITFISPTQAIVFWKSKEETLGYIKYGSSKVFLKETVLQTSSEPREIHVVFLENIPIEGMYIRKYNEGESFLIFPKTEYIKYDSNIENE